MATTDWEQHVLDSERGYVERELHAGVPQETPFLAPQLVRWSDILDVSWHYPYRGGVGYITIRRRGRGRRWLTAVYARHHGPNPLSEGELAGVVESFCDRAQTREQRAARLHERVRSAAETLRTIGVAVLPVGLVLAGVGVALLVQA